MSGSCEKTSWVVITGAPSCGKTTLIEELGQRGWRTVPEAARTFITSRLNMGLSLAEIRRDEKEFQNAILDMKLQAESALPPAEVIFLDRGTLDTVSYYRLAGLDPQPVFDSCRRRRYGAVFILDPLPLEADGIRVENSETAAKLDVLLEQDYRAAGYEPVRVPVMPVGERLAFIFRVVRVEPLQVEPGFPRRQ